MKVIVIGNPTLINRVDKAVENLDLDVRVEGFGFGCLIDLSFFTGADLIICGSDLIDDYNQIPQEHRGNAIVFHSGGDNTAKMRQVFKDGFHDVVDYPLSRDEMRITVITALIELGLVHEPPNPL